MGVSTPSLHRESTDSMMLKVMGVSVPSLLLTLEMDCFED